MQSNTGSPQKTLIEGTNKMNDLIHNKERNIGLPGDFFGLRPDLRPMLLPKDVEERSREQNQ